MKGWFFSEMAETERLLRKGFNVALALLGMGGGRCNVLGFWVVLNPNLMSRCLPPGGGGGGAGSDCRMGPRLSRGALRLKGANSQPGPVPDGGDRAQGPVGHRHPGALHSFIVAGGEKSRGREHSTSPDP